MTILHEAGAASGEISGGVVGALQSALKRAAIDLLHTPRSNRDGRADKHIEESRNRIRDVLYSAALSTPKASAETGGAVEAIAAAIKEADDGFGYSYRMTKLDGSVEEHTLFMDGHEPVVFADREDGYVLIEQSRNINRAARILAALSAAPSAPATSPPPAA